MTMTVEKVINNNLIRSHNENGQEILVMGCGLGFKKKPSDPIDEALIEKIFIAEDPAQSSHLVQLLSRIPLERVQVTNEIIRFARTSLGKKLGDRIYLTLTDHISYAIDRAAEGTVLKNALLWEIKRFYNREFLVSREALSMIHKRLGVGLPEDEAVFIALHPVNASMELGTMSQITEMTRIIQNIVNIVKYHYQMEHDEYSLHYERFITHLKFFVQRVFNGEELDKDDKSFLLVLKERYRNEYQCTLKIRDYMKREFGQELTEQEKGYTRIRKRLCARRAVSWFGYFYLKIQNPEDYIMDYRKLAEGILENVGGSANIAGLTHCATRLRFNLKDETAAQTEADKKLKGVMEAVKSGGQYQVIIGSDVSHIYKELQALGNFNGDGAKASKDVRSIGARLIDTLSGIFTPILPAITAAGMLRAVLALLVAFHWVDNASTTYQILNFMGDAALYFLPILLADSAARKLGCNTYLAMMLGGILLHPNFVSLVSAASGSGTALTVFGLPVYKATYPSSVVPIILTVWLMSYVEPVADRLSPKPIRFFVKPLIITIVTGIASLCVIGPVGYIIGNGIASVLTAIDTYCSWLVPGIIGLASRLLVMTGTHYGLVPVGINNRMTLGYDSFVNPGMLAM